MLKYLVQNNWHWHTCTPDSVTPWVFLSCFWGPVDNIRMKLDPFDSLWSHHPVMFPSSFFNVDSNINGQGGQYHHRLGQWQSFPLTFSAIAVKQLRNSCWVRQNQAIHCLSGGEGGEGYCQLICMGNPQCHTHHLICSSSRLTGQLWTSDGFFCLNLRWLFVFIYYPHGMDWYSNEYSTDVESPHNFMRKSL